MGNRGSTIAAALVWLAVPAWAGCRVDQVELRLPSGGMARFAVEVADDGAERAQGLMHRETLAMSAGMLFVYERPQRAGFWMKNTLVPLDMVFADPSGTVTWCMRTRCRGT